VIHSINGYDLHCHVDLHADPPALIRQCETERVVVLAVTTTPRAWFQNRVWTENSFFVHAAVGLHPELIDERYEEVAMLEDLIGRSRLVGEVGLDGSPRHRRFYKRQKEIFVRVLVSAAACGGRVLTIHSRRAANDVISQIERYADPKRVTCILHWFSGSEAALRRAISAGCYFSVNQSMLTNSRGRSLIKEIPCERLLTETDAPFIKVNGRSSKPTAIRNLLPALADLRTESVTRLREHVDRNGRHVFATAGIGLG